MQAWELVMAVVTAFIAAFSAEPVKQWIAHKDKVKRLRMALYKELIISYETLLWYLELIENHGQEVNIQELLSEQEAVFKHIINSSIIDFHEIQESAHIYSMYRNLAILKNKDLRRISPDERKKLVELISKQMTLLFKEREFDRKLLLRISKSGRLASQLIK